MMRLIHSSDFHLNRRFGNSGSATCRVIRPEVWLSILNEDGQMGTTRHKPEDVVAKLRQADVLIAQG